jgi:hypothetical protein
VLQGVAQGVAGPPRTTASPRSSRQSASRASSAINGCRVDRGIAGK